MTTKHLSKNIIPLMLCINALALAGCGARSDVKNLNNKTRTLIQPLVCGDLDAESCHANSNCLAAYDIAPPCAEGPCPESVFSSCVDQPTEPPMCTERSCDARVCNFGFATDVNGCEMCACLPPIGPCEDMNEAQCQEATACHGLYRSSGPTTGRSTGGSGSGGAPSRRPPCPESDPNCGGDPEPITSEFVSCLPRPMVETCLNNADCPGGQCIFRSSSDPSQPSPDPDQGQCVEIECSDDSVLICEASQPLCERGSVPAIRNGCWSCVDESSCGEDICNEPANVRRAYISRDEAVCDNLQPGFGCGGGSRFFNDACGCGCEVEETIECPPESENFEYLSRDVDVCARVDFICEDGFQHFSNACGCGCRRAATPVPVEPPTTTVIIDCGEGTEALCDSIPPNCDPDEILTIRDGCYACIAPDACERPEGD